MQLARPDHNQLQAGLGVDQFLTKTQNTATIRPTNFGRSKSNNADIVSKPDKANL